MTRLLATQSRSLRRTSCVLVFVLSFASFYNGATSLRRGLKLGGSFLASQVAIGMPITNHTKRIFPRWNVEGIDVAALFDFILNSSTAAHGPPFRQATSAYIPTSDHRDDVNFWFPETLYVVNGSGLWASQLHRNITDRGKGSVKSKLVPTEQIMMEALDVLANSNGKRWKRLRRLVQIGGGFPFLAWYGDFTGCNHRNWLRETSIPLFTTAARVDCKYAFPFPNYQSIRDASLPNNWYGYSAQYPWPSKKKQVVWRGSLTGDRMKNETHHTNLRWKMLRVAQTNKAIFDVGATRLPRRHSADLDLTSVGGLVHPIVDMREFQRYKGVLDLDGNSWSSRFGKLMCFNSVVVKVHPKYIDYVTQTLHPWKHYIPVRYDLSDLVEKAQFVANPSNDMMLQQIVSNANTWCRKHMVRKQLVEDILDIWSAYSQWMDLGTPNWQSAWTQSVQPAVFDSAELQMIQLTRSTDAYLSLEAMGSRQQ